MLLLPDIEFVAAEVHEAWMDGKRSQGVTSRKAEDGEELMVPYAELSEEQKEMDRSIVRTVYAAIQKAGEALPRDIVDAVRSLGPVELGYTKAYDRDGHLAHLRETLEITDRNFNQSGPQVMYGVYLADQETILCHTGTSPGSCQHARILAGLWNALASMVNNLPEEK